MPTPEEIKNLIKQYAKGTETKHFSAEMIESIVMGFYTSRLMYDYCIVPKELIRKRYENAKSTHELYTSATCINNMESRAIDHAEGRMCELNALFGTALFNEEKE